MPTLSPNGLIAVPKDPALGQATGRERNTVMPGFMGQVKQWIRDAAEEYGAHLTEEHAQALTGAYVTHMQVMEDVGEDVDRLTYDDQTGREAVRRWFAAALAVAP
jgi:hypothetical protein